MPIGVVTALFAAEGAGRRARIGCGDGTDVLGAVLITASLMLGVYTIVKPAAEHGWSAPAPCCWAQSSIALLALFVVREAPRPTRWCRCGIFRTRNVAGANLIQVLGGAGMFGMFFLGALYLQGVLGYDALEIGLAFLPTTICMGAMSLRLPSRWSRVTAPAR